jgi:GH15 family glucan-1,4-alpha-glucosidase
MSKPISDYAIIGDTHSSALIARNGDIDWLCWPRHDSPAIFTWLLDDVRGGRSSVQIVGGASDRRRYRPETAILETDFAGPSGRARLTDCMPVHPPSTRAESGPDGEVQSRLIRLLECTKGQVQGTLRVRISPDYGRAIALPTEEDDVLWFHGDGLSIRVTGSHPLLCIGGTVCMDFQLAQGERAFLAMTYDGEHDVPPLDTLEHAAACIERTEGYWSGWSDRICYDGAYREAVVRSAITLKLLTYSPTGAIIAAATTSLPEAVPGNRNYDYRYSWIRDASFTVTAFCNLGLAREAAEYLRFLRKADGTHGRELKLLYGIDGPIPPEQTLDHLPGWDGIRPVRIGNAADGQQQHDIYGEMMIALHAYLDAVGYQPPESLAAGMRDLIRTLAGHAMRCRHMPDQGIWELRAEPQHLQHSKAMLWVCLDRAVKTAGRLGGFEPDEIAEWRRDADDLHAEFEHRSWDPERGAYMQAFGSFVLDAAVLRTVLFGALEPRSARMASTLRAIEAELCDGDLVYRYRCEDGMQGEEATFTACAFWRVGVMALAGRTEEARAIFERLLGYANDVGLFAEEIDAATGAQRGNMPQGFTHMCVINHAVRLEQAIAQAAETKEVA